MLHIEKVYVDDYKEPWVQPHQLVKQYSITRPTVWRLLKKMRELPQYKRSFLDLSQTLKLVRAKDFQNFLYSQHQAYLKA